MPIRVFVYSHKAYNEYRLENNKQGESIVKIEREKFQISRNVNIVFNRIEDKWSFGENGQYVVYQNDIPYLGEVLSCGCIYKLVTNHKESLYLYAIECEEKFIIYNKYDISNISKITIGSDETNTIKFQNMSLVSRFHATIEKFHNGIILEDLSCNGVFINNKKLNETRTYLSFGSKIFMYGLEMIYLGDVLAINVHGYDDFRLSTSMKKYYEQIPVISDSIDCNGDNTVYFNRMPRGNTNIDKTIVKIMSKPNIDTAIDTTKYFSLGKENLMLFIMLLGVGAVVTGMYFEKKRLAIYILVAMIGCSISYLIYKIIEKYSIQKTIKYNREKELHSKRLYEKYLSEREEYIKERIDKDRKYKENRYKDATKYVEYDYTNMDLWNRNCNHNDFLKYRIGSGRVSSNIEFDFPAKEVFQNDFSLYNKLINLKRKYRVVNDMPICLDLSRDKIIGVVSENKNKGARDILNVLCTQISVNNCYTDVKIALVYEEMESDLSFYKWLPHIWSKNKNKRYIAKNEAGAKELFNELYNSLLKIEEKQYYILFVTKPMWLIKEPLFRLLQEKGNILRISVVMIANYCQELPNNCELILQNDDKYNGVLNVKTQKRTRIEFDYVEEEKVIQLCKRLASIHVVHEAEEKNRPRKCTVLQTFGVTYPAELDVENRWKSNNSYEGLDMPIGFDMDNRPFSLNIHEKFYGPHGLIAGTTGSGKSELLKSMILSLSINYSPNEVNFIIIDYKGSIMANELEGLPHIVGSISNLSKRYIDRVMLTINGEIDRREKILGAYGVDNIDVLLKLAKCGELTIKIPYLFIIVDEFAQLKEKEPEFIKELIGISQVGRSLGINLILSTQKPSGNIDDNIWSNARYKICLKVTNEQDSMDVLHKPDAVRISNAGGAFVQVGNDEIYEEIQVAYTKELYDKALVEKEGIAEIVEFDGTVENFNIGKLLKKKELLKIGFLEKLIFMLINVMKETNIAYTDDLAEEEFERVVNKLYDVIKSEGIDYKYNAINIGKLCNFVGLFILLNKNKNRTIHEQALELVKLSIEKDVQLPEVTYKTELVAVINQIIKGAKSIGYERQSLWLDELPTVLDLRKIPRYKGGSYFKAIVGVYDDPYNQQRGNIYIDFINDGNTIVYGEMLSGKTTLLQTVVFDLISHYSERELAIYGIDYNNGASIAFENSSVIKKLYIKQNSENVVEDVLNEVYDIIYSRKEKYTGSEIIQDWSEMNIKEPLVVLVIDDIAKLCNVKVGEYENKIACILKEGMGVGVYVLATANNMGTNGVASRVVQYFKNTICLQLKDKYEYMQYLHYIGEMVIPEKNIPGRGISVIDNRVLEFQVALYNGEVNDSSRLEAIRMECKRINKRNKPRTILDDANNIIGEKNKIIKAELKEGIKETRITVDKKNDTKQLNIKEIKIKLPRTWTNHKNNKDVKKCLKENKLPLGTYLDDEDSMYCVNLDSVFMFNIVGDSHTGKSGIMKVLMSLAALNKKDKVYIVDFTGRLYATVAQRIKANYVKTSEGFVAMCEDLAKEFAIRKESPKEDRIYVFGDMERFIKAIYMPLKSGIDARTFMENISQKGRGYKIYFIMEMDIKAQRKLKGYDVYNNFINYNTGICTSECGFDYDSVESINIPIIRG